MTRVISDGYEPGSAQECRADAEQYAAQAVEAVETADQMLTELNAAAASVPGLTEAAEATAIRAVLATTVSGALQAQLAVAARLGQVAAALGDWAAAPPVPAPPVVSRVAPMGPMVPSEALIGSTEGLAALPHGSVIVDDDAVSWQRHAPGGTSATWKSVTWQPGRPFAVRLLTSEDLMARGRGPFLLVWRGPGD